MTAARYPVTDMTPIMRRGRLVLLVALVSVVLGCGSAEPPPERSRTRAGLTGTLTLTPDSPTAMQPAQLLLTLHDAQDNPVNDARVAWDLTMPAMAMPDNTPTAKAQGQGRYRAEAIFTMSGKWRLEATITRPGGVATLDYDITVP